MSAQASPSAPFGPAPSISVPAGAATIWALLDVLEELPGSPEAQAELMNTREALRVQIDALGLRREDMRRDVFGLLGARCLLPEQIPRPRLCECSEGPTQVPEGRAGISRLSARRVLRLSQRSS